MFQVVLDRLNHAKLPPVAALSRARAAVQAEMDTSTTTTSPESVQTQLDMWEEYRDWREAMSAVPCQSSHNAETATTTDAGSSRKRSRLVMESEASALATSSSEAARVEFLVAGLMSLSLYNANAKPEEEAHALLVSQFQRVQMDVLAATNTVQDLQALRHLDGEDFRQQQRDLETRLNTSQAKVAHLRRALRTPGGGSLCASLED